MIRAGEICYIHEILSEARLQETSVRVLGTLLEYDAVRNLAIIEHRGCRLPVDATLLGAFPFRIGSLYQFIGETSKSLNSENPLKLRARVGRKVDGLDLELYEKALEVRRKFLADPKFFSPALDVLT